ncbi:Gfo/Idh/MocA family oxidoreductase [Candidatus Amarolinea dominans]|uniref:Gfo/Idh/MocA family protein n=1 Tax=Candidatus Amarolinea dominans TaxID=3140696 RepID=UPI003135CA78|nr:Gfo/Idh/MocA family oxidoreductase [Anaerolineae bacterium]
MRIGLLNLAHHHVISYIANLRALPGVELIGAADADQARCQHVAQTYGMTAFPSYDALLAARPDGVIVCAENTRHRALVEMAAAAGVAVLCEKPLATTLEDGRAMIDACRRAGVSLMTAFPMRFSAPLLELKALLDRGGLGQVVACNGTNQGQMPQQHAAWFVDPALSGGGALMDHIVHLADVLRWLLQSEVVEVYAQTNRIMHAASVTVETGGLVMLTFANGVFASIDCSWSKPLNYPTWGGLALEMIGTRGVVSADAFRQNLDIYNQRRGDHTWRFWGADADQALLAEFIHALRTQRAPAVSGEDGYRALQITLAAYTSAQHGQPVRLPLPDRRS